MLNRQRGFGYLELVIGLLLLGLGAGVVYTYKSAITRSVKAEAAEKKAAGERDTARQAHADQLVENANLRILGAQRDQILAELQGARNERNQIRSLIDGNLQNAYRNDPKAREWRDMPVPQSVVDSLRSKPGSPAAAGGQDGKGKAGGKPGGTGRDP
jgi:type II secretory pathway pseudopilin PulG